MQLCSRAMDYRSLLVAPDRPVDDQSAAVDEEIEEGNVPAPILFAPSSSSRPPSRTIRVAVTSSLAVAALVAAAVALRPQLAARSLPAAPEKFISFAEYTDAEEQGMRDKCNRDQITCMWTRDWNCPGQLPGLKGAAMDDFTEPFKCCCDAELWRQFLPDTAAAVPPSILEFDGPEADWRVVAGAVAVLAEPSDGATALGTRRSCDVVRAFQHGEWLKLSGEPGFIRASGAGDAEQFMEIVPVFLKIKDVDCENVGWYHIRDLDSCTSAASALGLAVSDVAMRAGLGGEACFWHDGAEGSEAVCASSQQVAKPCEVKALGAASPVGAPPASDLPDVPRSGESPLLYCYSVIRESGYERPLMLEQLKKGFGIFACDKFDVYSSPNSFTLGMASAGIGGMQVDTIVFQNAEVGVSKDNTAGNTELFMNVWNAVNEREIWKQTDFIVKADPDAVLIPERLKAHMRPYLDWGATYIKNCDKVPTDPDFPMMFGALEVFSREAMNTYLKQQEQCKQLPWHPWGEDFFMTKCLDKLGVYGLGDFEVLGDNYCVGASCGDGLMAAYHPFKTIDQWFDCWGQASVAVPKHIQPVVRPAGLVPHSPPVLWGK